MAPPGTLPAGTQPGRVALRVADLDRQVAFYEDVVGLSTIERTGNGATLGVDGTPLLELDERSALPPRTREETGLFHTAFLVPDRSALGDALARVEASWELSGASDHLVSEALYLDDPEGNGVELYRDRPRDEWTIYEDGRIDIDTLPLALDPIREAAAGADGAPPETTVGHVHLEVSDVEAARAFYVDELGLAVKATYGSDAIFLAAGEYHHHLGANTWNRRSARGEGLGLDWFEVVVPDEPTREAAVERLAQAGREPSRAGGSEIAVADPDGIEVRLRVAE